MHGPVPNHGRGPPLAASNGTITKNIGGAVLLHVHGEELEGVARYCDDLDPATAEVPHLLSAR